MYSRKKLMVVTFFMALSLSMMGCKAVVESSEPSTQKEPETLIQEESEILIQEEPETTAEEETETQVEEIETPAQEESDEEEYIPEIIEESSVEESVIEETESSQETDIPKEFTLKDEIANGSIEDLKIQICNDIIPLGSMITVSDFFAKYPDYRFTKRNGESIMVSAKKTDELCVHEKVEVKNDKLDSSFSLYVVHPGLEDASVMDCSVVAVMDLNKTAKTFAWYSGGYKYNEAINDDSLLPGYTLVDFWEDKVTVGTYSSNSGANHHVVEGNEVNIYGVKPVLVIAISQTGHRLNDLIAPYYANIKAYVTLELQGRYLNVLRDKD